MDAYFARYPQFNYNPMNHPMDEFRLLTHHHQGWPIENEDHERQIFRNAAVTEFNNLFGTNDRSIPAWHGMLRMIGVPEVDLPASITKCKKVRSALLIPRPEGLD
jgi:hypothetical protein